MDKTRRENLKSSSRKSCKRKLSEPHTQTTECQVIDLEAPSDYKNVQDVICIEAEFDVEDEADVIVVLEENDQASPKDNSKTNTSHDDTVTIDDVDNDEELEDIIFVEAVQKDKAPIEIVDLQDDSSAGPMSQPIQPKATVPQPTIPETSSNQNSNPQISSRRYFLSPQEAAADIVDTLLRLGCKSVAQKHMGDYTELEYDLLLQVKYLWLSDPGVRVRLENEEKQDFCWRVRSYTRKAFLSLARQMSKQSVLGWAITENYREHVKILVRQQQNNVNAMTLKEDEDKIKPKVDKTPTVKTEVEEVPLQVKAEDPIPTVKTEPK